MSILLIIICLFGLVSCNAPKEEPDVLTQIKKANSDVASYQISLNVTSTKNQNSSDSENIPMTIHGSLQQNNKSFSCSLSITENNLSKYGNHKNDIFLNKKINGDFDKDNVLMEIQTEQDELITEKSESKNEKIYSQFLSAVNNDAIVEKENDCYKIKVKQEDFKNAFKDCNEIAFNTIKEYLGTITTTDPKKDFEYVFNKDFRLSKININSLETRDEEFKYLSNIEILFEKHNEAFEVKKETLKAKDGKRTFSDEENDFLEHLSYFSYAASESDNIKGFIPQITLGEKINLAETQEDLVNLLKKSNLVSVNKSLIGTIYEYDIDGATLNMVSNSFNIDMEVLINDNTDKEFSINGLKLGSTKKDDVIKKYNNVDISTFGDKTIIEPKLDPVEKFECNLKFYFDKNNVLYGFHLHMYIDW